MAEAGKEDVAEAVQHAKAAWEEWFDRDGKRDFFLISTLSPSPSMPETFQAQFPGERVDKI